MPSPIADRVPERGLNVDPVKVGSPTAGPVPLNLFHGPDPSIHMLGLPKSYPQLGRWVALAILTGAITAFLLVVLADH